MGVSTYAFFYRHNDRKQFWLSTDTLILVSLFFFARTLILVSVMGVHGYGYRRIRWII